MFCLPAKSDQGFMGKFNWVTRRARFWSMINLVLWWWIDVTPAMSQSIYTFRPDTLEIGVDIAASTMHANAVFISCVAKSTNLTTTGTSHHAIITTGIMTTIIMTTTEVRADTEIS